MIQKELRYTQKIILLEDFRTEIAVVVLTAFSRELLDAEEESQYRSSAGPTYKVKEFVHRLAAQPLNVLQDDDGNQTPTGERERERELQGRGGGV